CPADRLEGRARDLAAAVCPQGDVPRQHREQAIHVAGPSRLREALHQAFGLPRVGLEASAWRANMFPRSREDLAAVGLRLFYDAGDLGVLEVEHLVQQEHRSLDRG